MKISVFYEHILDAVKQTGKKISDVLIEVKKAGIDYVEIDALRLDTDMKQVLEELREAGIAISCIYRTFDFGRKDNYDSGCRLVDMAVATKAKSILVIPGFTAEGDDRQLMMQNMAKAMNIICAYGRERDILVTIEDYDDCIAPFSTIEGLKWFMDNVEGLGCAFDTGNFLYSEENVLDAYDVLKDSIVHVHLKDRSFAQNDGAPKNTIKNRTMYPVSTGSGCIPMEQIIRQLSKNGYEGIYAIEHFGSKHQLDDMIKSAEYVKRTLLKWE